MQEMYLPVQHSNNIWYMTEITYSPITLNDIPLSIKSMMQLLPFSFNIRLLDGERELED